jgi:hypothetical protein
MTTQENALLTRAANLATENQMSSSSGSFGTAHANYLKALGNIETPHTYNAAMVGFYGCADPLAWVTDGELMAAYIKAKTALDNESVIDTIFREGRENQAVSENILNPVATAKRVATSVKETTSNVVEATKSAVSSITETVGSGASAVKWTVISIIAILGVVAIGYTVRGVKK